MSSSFFLSKERKQNKKRKQTSTPTTQKSKKEIEIKKKKLLPRKKIDEVLSDEDNDCNHDQEQRNLVFSSDEKEEETPQDKRLRLAKQYLEEIEKQEAERVEEREIHNFVTNRLQTEYLDSAGRLRRNIAANVSGYDVENVRRLKHKLQHLSVCTLVLTADEKYIFSGSKTPFVLKWNLVTLKVEGSFNVQKQNEEIDNGKKRRPHVIAMCMSSDMKFLALAEGGNNIQIWCPHKLKHLKTFKGHRDIVTALVFRKDSHDLYSGSRDRAVKIWSLDEMAYVESLFGHQACITAIDALSRERAITSGGTDCSLRIWKITEESQLIYNGHHGSIDNVKFINDEHFISSGNDGSLCLWSALKKKPLCAELQAHGIQKNKEANWITAITCVVNTDLIASGSCDGYIRLWQSVDNARKLHKILDIPMSGFINGITFNADGTKLYAAIGQEHRLGRWCRIKEGKNQIAIIDLITGNVNY